MTDNLLVMYHAHCADGFGAAWAFSKRFPDARFVAMNYGDDLPDLTDVTSVYLVDFSLPCPVMEQLHERLGVDNVVLLDHHETSAQNLVGMPNCHIDQTRSGAVLAWEHCFPDKPVPVILRYVQDRDLWTWELPDSRAVNAYIASWSGGGTFDRWDQMADEIAHSFGSVTMAGSAILRSQGQMVATTASQARYASIDGHRVPLVQSAVLASELGEKLLELHPDAPFAAIYCRDGATTVRYSLRARAGGHNVAQTAERFDGGGHPAAAGFKMRSAASHLVLTPTEEEGG